MRHLKKLISLAVLALLYPAYLPLQASEINSDIPEQQSVKDLSPVASSKQKANSVSAEDVFLKDKIDVLYMIHRWIDAWEAKNVDAYLSAYSTAFTPPLNMNLEQWQAQRRQAITQPHSINISISEEKIKPVSANQVQATFIQEYRSDAFRDKTKKTLILEKESEGWKIVKEKSSINE